MMPILWRYLLSHFLKVALFCCMAFVIILLTMQLDEIAHFAALGAPLSYIALFTFYQIPYILPIAIPISCLIAAIVLMQKLSRTHELTALRAAGYGLRNILLPVLLTAAFLSFFNFWIISEVATQSHLTTSLLKSKLRAINPLLLLNNKHLMRLKGIYFDALGPSRVGESASDIILCIPNTHQERLNLLFAKNLKSSPNIFIGQGVTFISTMDSKQKSFDHLLIENVEELVSSTEDFAQLLQKKVWTVNNDYLKLSLLSIRIEEQQQTLQQARQNNRKAEEIKQLDDQLNRSYVEVIRRISIAGSVFSFTLMGAAFGITISRKKKNYLLTVPIILTVLYLISYFIAKGVDQNLFVAYPLFIGPHVIIVISSIFMLTRISKGRE